ncbi:MULTISPECIES: methylmalonyl-CoA mutase family protein [unclassified Wenzhouxiangella]|uniref:methylmalonyl-CoA mutase family protein n=1 Tax=unclassified Wenzhouxiangella TaxID=2613841 RepID=UPI000E328AF3|nr:MULTISPECIES: methylmalonyl-CoA mutase family protein [unclassified Wenzhouxiangella]RFF27712.1 methylmalonyl-CoA mutase [Wenzhouxiangella sp. 15181]RFP69803.1 methylmalonyl-CoA mutase [Wenzhouxiangella sp. 15190]
MSQTAESLSSTPSTDSDLPLRVVTAASLFDGHDAAINLMRRLIQAEGCEVVHLGHNRSVADIVRAALCEDADAVAVSSYQGGHMEYFKYMVDMFDELGAGHIKVFGGGGGTITLDEIRELEDYGVTRIYHPEHGMKMGLKDMIADLVERTRQARASRTSEDGRQKSESRDADVAEKLSAIENGTVSEHELAQLRKSAESPNGVPIVGLTGTGGAGKSSVTDELLNRFLQYFPDMRIAVLAVDPTRRRTGGALLGDRIRMNSLRSERVFMRSMATRRQHLATSEVVADSLALLRTSDFDLVILETAGIGQSDSEVVDLVDFPAYVMTSDFGAASQLEKIDMLDFAELVVLNKFDRQGSQDALRDVRKQWKRNRLAFDLADEDVPVYPTIASQFNDPGVTWMFVNLCRLLRQSGETEGEEGKAVFGTERCDFEPEVELAEKEPRPSVLIPGKRVRYLAEIAEQGRTLNEKILSWAEEARRAQHYYEVLGELGDSHRPEPVLLYPDGEIRESLMVNRKSAGDSDVDEDSRFTIHDLRSRYNEALKSIPEDGRELLRQWPDLKAAVEAEEFSYQVRGKEITGSNYRESLSRLQIPKIAPPQTSDWGEQLVFLMKEHLPGHYPYTGGVYPYRRANEDPIRMFAGEGTPERTNRRFHYVSEGQPAKRLSTAFDSVTLYGEDPAERPDIYGKVGNSGVSIATLDDMKKLYSGFDLADPATSVSMTINGPAPMIMAMFMNTAVDQQVEKHLKETGEWDAAQKKRAELLGDDAPEYTGELPKSNDGLGLGTLGVTGDQLVDTETYEKIKAETLKVVRGTVQADILKEDQAQNTCIFSTEFALHMMGDIQQYFIDKGVRNFYSVSISGYHIAEAGANPISQLAFTLSNGFTIVEYYLARGMDINEFAPNLSFFFSNGMDPEYSVIGRVARRIWARAMRERYGANKRSQMLKYHIQTSGRSLHAQEIQFNDIRTTLQALYAIFDNCNSLHTNAYDEAITTPTEESVRRAVAIQMIINKELGLNYNENPFQGSYIIDQLTDLVEDAVYAEFERLSERGGVLGAMDTMYQRGKIQEESLYYEHKKHDGSLPLVGVNTFLPAEGGEQEGGEIELARSTTEEKQQQVGNVQAFNRRNEARSQEALRQLQAVARERGNTFEALMEAVKCCSLGQISHALYAVGGEYRRNM